MGGSNRGDVMIAGALNPKLAEKAMSPSSAWFGHSSDSMSTRQIVDAGLSSSIVPTYSLLHRNQAMSFLAVVCRRLDDGILFRLSSIAARQIQDQNASLALITSLLPSRMHESG